MAAFLAGGLLLYVLSSGPVAYYTARKFGTDLSHPRWVKLAYQPLRSLEQWEWGEDLLEAWVRPWGVAGWNAREADWPDARALWLTTHDERYKAIAKLTPERHRGIVEKFRQDARGDTQFDTIRMQLGDDELIRAQAEIILRNNGYATDAVLLLGECRDPKVIKAIAPALFHRDLSQAGDISQSVLRQLILQSPAFTEAVHQWIRDIKGLSYGYFQMMIFREWWKANAVHLCNGNYQAVQPGAYPPSAADYEVGQNSSGHYYLRKLPGTPEWAPVWPPQTDDTRPDDTRPQSGAQ